MRKGSKHTQETINKLKMANKGKHLSPSTQFKKGNKTWHDGLGKGWIDSGGYKNISINGKQIPEHHYIWREANNYMPIIKGFCIHHRDGNKINNDINNLVLLPTGYHHSIHNLIRGDLI